MKKLIISNNNSSALMLDTESLELKEVAPFKTNIDYAYIAEEDCDVILNDNTYTANKGDIVVKLYGYGPNRGLVIMKCDDLIDYAKEQESKRSEYKNYPPSECCDKASISQA